MDVLAREVLRKFCSPLCCGGARWMDVLAREIL